MIRIYTIGGFTETARDSTGLEDVHRCVIKPYANRHDVEVQPVRPWKDDWKGLARRAHRDDVQEVVIIAYSWGAGWGAQRFARELRRHWIKVRLMLLCDPVYRPLWLPSWGFANLLGFRALIKDSATIEVPDNVRDLRGLRQDNKSPRGHACRWGGRKVVFPKVANATHTNIDSSPAWEALVGDALFQSLGRP